MQVKKAITVGLDSSGPKLLVAVSDGERTFSAHQTGIKQEQFFLPLLQRTLTKADARLDDIKRVFLIRGPGRFTGLRISLTFASMMQRLSDAAVCGATLFEVLHRQVLQSLAFQSWKEQEPQGVVAVVLHAFREEYFLQIFDKEAQPPLWLSKEQLLERLAAYPAPLYVAGTDKDGEYLAGLLGKLYRLAPLADSRVRPQTLLEMAQDPQYEKNALEPLYLKPARFELEQ